MMGAVEAAEEAEVMVERMEETELAGVGPDRGGEPNLNEENAATNLTALPQEFGRSALAIHERVTDAGVTEIDEERSCCGVELEQEVPRFWNGKFVGLDEGRCPAEFIAVKSFDV